MATIILLLSAILLEKGKMDRGRKYLVLDAHEKQTDAQSIWFVNMAGSAPVLIV